MAVSDRIVGRPLLPSKVTSLLDIYHYLQYNFLTELTVLF